MNNTMLNGHKTGHNMTLVSKYNALVEEYGEDEMLTQIELWMDDKDLESVIRYIEDKRQPQPIFQDMDGNELKEGDKVVLLDTADLEYAPKRGAILYINELIDLESNLINAGSHQFFGHRVLKIAKP